MPKIQYGANNSGFRDRRRAATGVVAKLAGVLVSAVGIILPEVDSMPQPVPVVSTLAEAMLLPEDVFGSGLVTAMKAENEGREY